MGVTSKTVIKIECDNPNCPGNTLDPKSIDGWYRVNVANSIPVAVAKDQTPMTMPVSLGEKFFCSPACAASIEQVILAEEEAREEAAKPPDEINPL